MSKNSEKRNDQVEALQIISTGRPDKGLPDEKALLDLARTYLEIQHRLWPQLVGTLLPAISEAEIEGLAAAFRERFLSGTVGRFRPEVDSPPWLEIAAGYLRYSCDASNPRSLDQQLRNELERAAQDKVFIPWEYVFADAAVTGTTAARRGYLMIKSLNRDIALIECQVIATGEVVPVICAVNRQPGGKQQLVPFAELFRGDQYDRFCPRRSNGPGFVSQAELRGELN